MKFVKGMVVGTAISAGIMMIYSESMNKKNLIKKGKQIAKKWGII